MELRADLENRIYKQEKKSKVPKWLFFGVLAMCAIGLLIYFKSDIAVTIEQENTKQPDALNQLLNESENHVITNRSRKPVTAKPENVTNPSVELWEQENKENQRKRQTVFNDDNYVPRGAHNITPAITTSSTVYSEQTQQKEKFSYKRSVPWTWESYGSGFSKHSKRGKFTYIETESGIDTASVCANYKYGSLDYRDCRKAAKKWFKDKCSNSFPQACLAGNMIP